MATSNLASARLNRYLLISTYLTTVLACACLVFAEMTLMPEIMFFAVVASIALIAAFALEGRWSLSPRRANVAAVIIVVFLGIWVIFQSLRPSAGLLRQIPWPTSLLPYLGPVLLLLLPAKLIQPKSAMDYWWVHLTGLAAVGLGCVLAEDPTFGLVMLLYLLSLVWCLALFLLYREGAQSAKPSLSWRLPGPWQIIGWAAPIVVLAAVVFLYTPRLGTEWNLEAAGRGRMETGMPEEPAIDLNKSSTVDLNREVAFDVYAQTNTGQPKLDLPGDQRWRGPAFSNYERGRWTNSSRREGKDTIGATTLPDLGPNQYFLNYHLKGKLHNPFIADPVQFSRSRQVPVIQLLNSGEVAAFSVWPDGLLTPARPMSPGRGRYKQVAIFTADRDLGPKYTDSQVVMFRQPLGDDVREPIGEWTRHLLNRLADSGALPREMTELDSNGEFRTENHEAIARALERYLSSSGEYHYTLELTRADTDLDPVIDFLLNTKTGHCNRFASALAVMLRSLNIPARVVLGFRGADTRGDGWYDVRQCHAHSWVEVFVNRPEPQTEVEKVMGQRGRDQWHSLALDPSPLDESIEAVQDAGAWWNSGSWDLATIFKDLFMNYSTDRRDRLYEQVGDTATAAWKAFRRNFTAAGSAGARFRTATFLSFGLLVLSIVAAIRWQFSRRRRRQIAPNTQVVAFHQRLLKILARRGWTPAQTQTAREFAESLDPQLRSLVGNQAAFVRHVADLYYRVRFGQEILDQDENRQIDADLDRLAAALAQSGN
jgi:transglutaminase-like putative cysteine protease